jgi:integrase
MAYVIKRPNRHGAERFTGMYKAADGTYKSAGTYDTEPRALEVAEESEQHAQAQLTSTSPADKATMTLAQFMSKFLTDHDIEANSKEAYARQLTLHALPYIGGQRVAEISRETIHQLLTVVLKEDGASQVTILHTRTALSSMMQMAWDHGYRKDNPVRGIKLKGVPTKPIVVATKDQFLRVYSGLPTQPSRVLARLGVSSGCRLCELISFIPEDFDFASDMLSVRRSTVEVTAEYHPTGGRFLTRAYTKNGEHRRFKIDHAVGQLVQEHIVLHGIAPGQQIFPARLFASTEAAGKPRLSSEEMEAFGYTDELPNGLRYKHGTLGAYVTVKCRCPACKQWSRDYSRDRKRAKTGRSSREWSPKRRSDPTEYLGADVWRRIWNKAVADADLPFDYTPYQVRHTHASWLIDQGVDLARVQYRLGHGDLQATTRYVKILDAEDTKAADVMATILGEVALHLGVCVLPGLLVRSLGPLDCCRHGL